MMSLPLQHIPSVFVSCIQNTQKRDLCADIIVAQEYMSLMHFFPFLKQSIRCYLDAQKSLAASPDSNGQPGLLGMNNI